MSKQQSKKYELAERLVHLLTKVEELMEDHKELIEPIAELEVVKKHIVTSLIGSKK
jgi:hypothetical protein